MPLQQCLDSEARLGRCLLHHLDVLLQRLQLLLQPLADSRLRLSDLGVLPVLQLSHSTCHNCPDLALGHSSCLIPALVEVLVHSEDVIVAVVVSLVSLGLLLSSPVPGFWWAQLVSLILQAGVDRLHGVEHQLEVLQLALAVGLLDLRVHVLLRAEALLDSPAVGLGQGLNQQLQDPEVSDLVRRRAVSDQTCQQQASEEVVAVHAATVPLPHPLQLVVVLLLVTLLGARSLSSLHKGVTKLIPRRSLPICKSLVARL